LAVDAQIAYERLAGVLRDGDQPARAPSLRELHPVPGTLEAAVGTARSRGRFRVEVVQVVDGDDERRRGDQGNRHGRVVHEVEPLAPDGAGQLKLLAEREPGDRRLDRAEVRARRRVVGEALAAEEEDVLVLPV